MKVDISSYRRLHQGIKLWARQPLAGIDLDRCHFLLGILEQAVHKGFALSEFKQFNLDRSATPDEQSLIHQLGQSLDMGASSFFLTYRPEKVTRYIAELLPALGICVKDWQSHPVRIPYWNELLVACQRSLREVQPERDSIKVLQPLLETIHARRTVTSRIGSNLGQDIAAYLATSHTSTPSEQELCRELAQLLMQPEDLVLIAVATPNAWVRRIARDYLERNEGP